MNDTGQARTFFGIEKEARLEDPQNEEGNVFFESPLTLENFRLSCVSRSNKPGPRYS